MNNTTIEQYNECVKICRKVFGGKMHDYGTAWRILRPSSLTDQIYIKAARVRSIEEKGESKVDEDIRSEFIGMINYSIMALIQLELGVSEELRMDDEFVKNKYDECVSRALSLMTNKNHDYDEAWRKMRVSSITDIILMKLLRIKQIEDNDGVTLISEGVDANYLDIINYSVFALILLNKN